MAVLSRMANLDHEIEPGPGDTVILASSLIPGNENAVYRVIDGLTKLGANVVHKGNAKVHVSGHAAAGELLYCYNILKPRNVLPVHGEYRHLMANARLAQDTGIPAERTIIGENGTVDRPEGRRRAASSASSTSASSTSTARRSARSRMPTSRTAGSSARRASSRSSSSSTPRPGRIITGPEIHARGFAEDDAVFDDVKPKIAAALAEAAKSGVRDPHALVADRAPHDRPLGEPVAAPPADDRAARHRGVTPPRYTRRMPASFRVRPASQADGAFLGDMVVEAANWRPGRRAAEAPGDDERRAQPLPLGLDAPGRCRASSPWTSTASRSGRRGTGCCRAAIPGFGYVGTGRARADHRRAADLARARRGPGAAAGALRPRARAGLRAAQPQRRARQLRRRRCTAARDSR